MYRFGYDLLPSAVRSIVSGLVFFVIVFFAVDKFVGWNSELKPVRSAIVSVGNGSVKKLASPLMALTGSKETISSGKAVVVHKHVNTSRYGGISRGMVMVASKLWEFSLRMLATPWTIVFLAIVWFYKPMKEQYLLFSDDAVRSAKYKKAQAEARDIQEEADRVRRQEAEDYRRNQSQSGNGDDVDDVDDVDDDSFSHSNSHVGGSGGRELGDGGDLT